MLAGYWWWTIVDGRHTSESVDICMSVLASGHTFVQWIPLLSLVVPSLASCSTGLPWLMHAGYLAFAVLAAPSLGGKCYFYFDKGGTALGARYKIPCIGWTGSRAADFYFYLLTLLHV